MKKLICLFALALCSCASREEIAQKQAAEDHAFCASVWGDSQEGYANCRMARDQQHYGSRQSGAALSSLMGMQLLQNSQQQYYVPPQRPVTCYQQGYYTTCQ